MGLVLQVQGMGCHHCIEAITTAVKQVPGATEVNVDVSTGLVTVDRTAQRGAVAAAIVDSGYEVVDLPQSAPQ